MEHLETSATAPYRNADLSVEARVDDLIGRMTLDEKAGQFFHDMILIGPDGNLAGPIPDFHIASTEDMIGIKHMTHFNLVNAIENIQQAAGWYNKLQARALQERLGIPISLSSDPRNHFTDNPGTSSRAGVFSQFPETLGFAALRDPAFVERFGDIARQEYCAVGLRVALHPQVDLATEPRWARIGATFGEDADLSSQLVKAYILGFQGKTIGPESVSTMTKHFPGGGPQKDGEDPHFTYGREQVYPGKNQEYHLRPFKAAIEVGGSQMMPYYGLPIGTEWEEAAFGFNKDVISKLLRQQLGFNGIICTDWGLITDSNILGQDMPARAWGVEHLSELQRVVRVLEAGCDQFGGESRSELIVKAVRDGLLPESRLDESLRRILREKFVLGLFENPFVDVEAALKVVGNSRFRKEGEDAQRRSYVLLKNKDQILPLHSSGTASNLRVYSENIDSKLLTARGWAPVSSPTDASIAFLRLRAPFEPRPGGFEAMFHAGSLQFSEEEQARQAKIYAAVPTVVDMYLDRPAVAPEIADRAAAFLVSFGSSADAFLDIVTGVSKPEGKLPFDLPSSMAAVAASRSDVQFDTKNPTFRFGHGLNYA